MIVLTGASGFLGSYLAKAFKDRSLPFKCLLRHSSKSPTDFSCAALDFSNSSETEQALAGASILIHAAGRINGSTRELWQSNVELTRQLVEGAQKAKISRIILISSVATLRTHGEYGRTKAEAEKIVRSSGIPCVIFRPAFIYGRGDENNTGLMLRTLERSLIIPLLGGGSFKLQPVYVGDVTEAVLTALKNEKVTGEFNIAGPAQISLKEILEILAAQKGLKRIFVPVPLKPVQALMRIYLKVFPGTRLPAKQILELDKHEAFDISKTREILNFNPMPFAEGVRRMAGDLCAA